MNINPSPADGEAADEQENQAQENNGNDDAISSRERSVTAREVLIDTHEKSVAEQDSLVQGRKQAVGLREKDVASREESIENAEDVKVALESHVARLQQANEHLVIAAIQAQAMTEEIQKAKDQMGHMAHHDFLTDLPNRILLKERLIQSIALAKRHGTKLAVLFMDLDRFKTINDSLGHAIGDTLLQSVARRLLGYLRITDTVSRQGGDEFVLLLTEIADEAAAMAFADKIGKAITAPYAIAGQDLHIGVTIGISMYPDDGEDAETLISNADVAMYHAKNSGRDRYQFFRPEMNARAVERQRVEGDIHRALKQQEFELYYQAQVDLQTGNILGAEALIRWHHPTRGLLLPAMFVPIAEECGAITAIGRWTLREACRQTQAWLDASLPFQGMAVNISGVELGRNNFSKNVRTILRETGLAPHHLELELTETVLMKNAESTMTTLQELKALGIKIAIDDFGTGYSSLSYLKQFPVDTLKIDQSFVAGIVTDGDDDILVDAVIGLGKSLRHRVIAEGIETHEQLTFLINHHCTEGQGYYLSPPMCAGEFASLLATGIPPNSSHRFTTSP